jgi:hypothetical protein
MMQTGQLSTTVATNDSLFEYRYNSTHAVKQPNFFYIRERERFLEDSDPHISISKL